LKVTGIQIQFYRERAVFDIQKKKSKAGRVACKPNKNALDDDTYSE
jgi:hypothetical protein